MVRSVDAPGRNLIQTHTGEGDVLTEVRDDDRPGAEGGLRVGGRRDVNVGTKKGAFQSHADELPDLIDLFQEM
jgi:hypothetical protein